MGNVYKLNGKPGKGEMDVEVYKIDHDKNLAFARGIDPEGGWVLARDGISACQVALRIAQIKDEYARKALRKGARFRAILSRTREGSTFDYFGEVIKTLD